ncbi:DUF6452 family protein [Ohtaekwangia sp.]|uniref:DUF6452 family protein n=1 Tax=Ohtaekwangia sp. TaxID=2066019 RepID=UPI002FDE4840
MKKTSWFIFCLVLAVSCLDEPDCYQLNNDLLGISFHVMGSTVADTLKATLISFSGTNATTADTTTAILLPLNYTTTSTNIFFARSDGSKDTLDLKYTTKVQFVSEDCGSRYILSGLDVMHYSFDSIRLVSNAPTKSGAINIEVYRCPKVKYVGLTLQQLYISGTSTQSATTLPATFSSITADFSGEQIYGNNTRSTLYLPVDLTKETSTYTFNFTDNFTNGNKIKKLTVNYDTIWKTRYKQCGLQEFVTNLRVVNPETPTAQDFDTVAVALKSNGDTLNVLGDPPVTNVKIMRCPITNLTQIVFRKVNTTTAVQVHIKRITNNYSSDEYYAGDTTSVVKLPLNPNAAVTSTEFYIEYTDRSQIDTVSVQYTLTTNTLFKGCGPQTIYSDLAELVAHDNVIVLETNDVKFPPVTNIAVEVN